MKFCATFWTLGVILAPLSAQAAAEVTIPLAGGDDDRQITAHYSCGGGAPFAVQYVNVGDNRLAILPIDGRDLVFVNVIAADGARYVAQQYEWWSKGVSATLTDAMADGPAQQCVSTDYPQQ